MPERENFYTPERVDEEIEALLYTNGSPTRDQRLMQDLSSIHRPLDSEDERSLERVLSKLVKNNDVSSHQTKSNSMLPLEGEISFIHNTGLIKQNTQKMHLVWQRLGVLAAMLVIVVMVGSMFIVLNIAHRGPQTTHIGSTKFASTPTTKQQPGQIVYQSDAYDLVTNLKWSPDGSRIAGMTLPAGTNSSEAVMKDTLQSWDALNHQHVLTYKVAGVSFYGARDIAWSPDGKRLAIATQKTSLIDAQGHTVPLPTDTKIYIFDAQTTHLLTTFSAPSATAYSPATGASRAGVALLSSTMTLAGGGPAFSSISWSPDNQWVAAAYSDNNLNVVYIGNTKTDHLTETLTGFQQNIEEISWSPDGKFLATRAYTNDSSLVLKIWDTTTWNTVKQYNNIYSFSWSPDGKQLALVDADQALGKDVRIVNTLSGQTTRQFSDAGYIEDIYWSPDGSRIAVLYQGLAGKGNVILWSATSGQQLFRFAPSIDHHLSWVYQLSWSPDSKYLTCVTTGQSPRILVWVAP